MSDGVVWPRISIVTPSYNQGDFIEETIRSVLLQGYPNLEYIVMDGGSRDGSVEIIRRYEACLSHVHIGPDGGQAAAIDEGFRLATGEILAWLNSDDRYRPGTLFRVGRFFAAHPKIVFGNGDVNYIDAEGRFAQRIYAIQANRLLTANLGKHGWPQQGCFWRSSAYQKVGGMDPSLRFCMDRDLFLRLARVGKTRRIPGRPLAEFRIHEHAKTKVLLDVASTESKKLLAKYGNERLGSVKWLLEFLWWLWCKPPHLRVRLNRRYGWEW
jgi:glycosyltransferase involved in cell wall biosynthesis